MTKDELNRRIAELHGYIYVRGTGWLDGGVVCEPPDYTTWPHAGVLLEELIELDWNVCIDYRPTDNQFIVATRHETPYSPTIPEAVARAWLAWKEAK